MTAVTRCLVVVLMSYVLLGGFTSEAQSYNVYNFLSNLNGDFDNKAQAENDTQELDFIQDRFIPVTVAGLSDAPVLFLEEVVGGQVVRSYVNKITEEDSGRIKLIFYNVTKPNFHESPPRTITTEEVSNLQLEDLQEIYECSAEFETFGTKEFVGSWGTCQDVANGVKSFYGFYVACDDYFVTVPTDAVEKKSHAAYHMRRTRSRYPVPGIPDDFISGCDREINNSKEMTTGK